MNNETLAVLENCKDYIEQIKDDALAKHLIKEIDRTIENEHICKDSIYIYETISLHQSDGELYVEYGDINDTKMLVFNIDNLYKDLGTWIYLVKEGNAEMQQMYKNSIDKEIKDNHCIIK